ncbi:hypothetical protein ABPG72_001381 [Tetrahymena utriculariae]
MQKKLISLIFLISLISAYKVDVPTCIERVANFSRQIQGIAQTASLEKQSLGKFLNSTFVAFQGVNPLLESCGLDFQVMDKIMSFKPASQEQCFQNIANLISHSNTTYQFYKNTKPSDSNFIAISANYYFFGKEMLIEAQQMIVNCKIVQEDKNLLSLSFDSLNFLDLILPKCLIIGQNLTRDAIAFVNNTIQKAKPISDLFVDAAYMYNTAVDALPICGYNYTLPKINDIEDKKYCVNNLSNIIKTVNQTIHDIQSKNYTNFGDQLKQIYINSVEIFKKCKINKKPVLAAYNSCFSNTQKLSEELKTLIKDIQSGKNKEEISSQLYKIIGSVQHLINQCGFDMDFGTNFINPYDLQMCVQDFKIISKHLESIMTTLNEKKFINIGKEVSSFISLIFDSLNQCKLKKSITQ